VNDHSYENDSPVDIERLIARVVDGEATSTQWRIFCSLAEADPTLWRQLAEAQHQQAELSAQVMRAVAVCEEIEAPVQEELAYRFNQRLRTAVVVGGWSGWLAAAAAMLVAWGVGIPSAGTTGGYSNGASMQAGFGGWADALQAYLEGGRASGHVVGELPERILLEARPVSAAESRDGGRYEVIYLRQIMERAVIKEFYGMGSDDLGRPAPVRIHIAPAGDGRPM
jgi:anti-sigma factor RsiW